MYWARAVVMLRKRSCNHLCITLVRLDTLLTTLFKLGGRSKNYTVNPRGS